MTLALLLTLAAPSTCHDVRQQCRACTIVEGTRQCSTVGIACQPVIRLCRPGKDVSQSPQRKNMRERR